MFKLLEGSNLCIDPSSLVVSTRSTQTKPINSLVLVVPLACHINSEIVDETPLRMISQVL